jgi:hypothetical protein
MSKLQEKTLDLIRGHPALQKLQFFNFFLCLWVIFADLDPDPDYEFGSGYGSRDLIESGFHPDPNKDPDSDPQHCTGICKIATPLSDYG